MRAKATGRMDHGMPPPPNSDRRRLPWLLLVACSAGVLFAFVTPPFQVADEPAHFYRAFALSEGQLLPAVRADTIGAVLPSALVDCVSDADRRSAWPAERTTSWSELGAALRIRLQPEERSFVDFRNTAVYSSLPYLPQALGIRLARLLTDRVLLLLLAARLANLAVSLALVWLALASLPTARLSAPLIALAPMSIQLLASASGDATNIAAGCLCSALLARLALAEGGAISSRDIGEISLGLFLLGSGKPVYAPVALLVFAVPGTGFRSRRAHRWFVALALFSVACGLALSLHAAQRVRVPLLPGAGLDPAAQAHALVASPARAAGVLLNDLVRHAPRYLAEALGSRLGWLDTPIPRLWVWIAFAVLLLSLFLSEAGEPAPTGRLRFMAAVAVATTSAAIALAQYLQWTPVGAASIEGIQGRYFLPVAWLAAIACVAPWRKPVRAWSRIGISIWIALSAALAAAAVLWRFYR